MPHEVQLPLNSTTGLADSQSCLNFFKAQTLRHLRYWGNHQAVKTLELATLDRRRESILSVISFGLELQEAWPLVRDLMLAFTHFMERRGYWQVWNDLLQRAMTVPNQVGDVAGAITLSALLARLYSRQSRPKETIYHYRRVIRLARRTGQRYEEARACSNLGYLFVNTGHWWRAEVLCGHALAIFEELASEHGRAHTENHLGVLYIRQHAWAKAERHLHHACSIWRSMGDDHGLSRGFLNLGILYLEKRSYAEALIYLEKALVKVKVTGEEAEVGHIWNNMAIAYRDNGDLDQAEAYARQAETIYRKYANFLGLAQVWDNLGGVYLRQQRWSEAGQYLHHSWEGYRYLNNWDGEIKVLLEIVEYDLITESLSQARLHLHELEALIMRYTQGPQQEYLNQQLKDYRRRLDR